MREPVHCSNNKQLVLNLLHPRVDAGEEKTMERSPIVPDVSFCLADMPVIAFVADSAVRLRQEKKNPEQLHDPVRFSL